MTARAQTGALPRLWQQVNQPADESVGACKEDTSGHLHTTREDVRDFDVLYATHRARILHLCRLLLRDPDEAEEVTQEVFVKLVHALRAGDAPAAWAPWLTRVTVNACHDRHRSGWWRYWRERHEALEMDRFPAAGRTPEEAAVSAEQWRRIWRAFRTLPARQREVFVLRCVEEWPTEAAAAALGISTGSLKRHLFRAVHRLRGALGGSE